MRCLHLNSQGEQCPGPALEGREFCEAHLPGSPDEILELPPGFRVARRLGAALLLGIFLLQVYVVLKALFE
jgi:hypothetical protein